MTITEETKKALDRWSGLPMEWGKSDCATAIADIYVAANLPDPMSHYRGSYTTRFGAVRLMGRGGLLQHVAALGWARQQPEEAQDGDLGLLDTDDGPACVIFYGGFWVGRIDWGFATHPATAIKSAWRPVCLKQ